MCERKRYRLLLWETSIKRTRVCDSGSRNGNRSSSSSSLVLQIHSERSGIIIICYIINKHRVPCYKSSTVVSLQRMNTILRYYYYHHLKYITPVANTTSCRIWKNLVELVDGMSVRAPRSNLYFDIQVRWWQVAISP